MPNATVKYLTYNASTDAYSEDANGAIPCLEWTTTEGDVKRILAFECFFKLKERRFRVSFKVQIQTISGGWIDDSKTKIGYEINFTKYFYEFKPLRSLADIKADILALEEKTLEIEKTVLE